MTAQLPFHFYLNIPDFRSNLMVRICSLLLVLVFISASAPAQKRYYNTAGRKCKARQANSYVIFSKEDAGFAAKQYSLRDELMMEGTFTAVADDINSARQGVFIYYHRNGRVARKGNFANSQRTGTWHKYAYVNGNLTGDDQYDRDTLNGSSIQYSSTTGDVQLKGRHEHGLREGPWRFYSRQRLHAEWLYTAGRVVQVRIFDATGYAIKVMSYRDERLTAAHAFDGDGREYPYNPTPADSIISYPADQAPSAPYDMNMFFSANLRYPAAARKNNIEGSVVVRFLVDEQGNISTGQVLKSVAPDLDTEALRIVALLPPWMPALQNGDPVAMWCTLPIIFQLGP